MGVLRFRSPNSAWTLDGSARATVGSTDREAGNSADNFNASISSQVGLRRYHAARGQIRAFHGAGLTGSVASTSTESEALIGDLVVKRTTSGFQLGAFGELGASYFVTSHLALGARGVASVGYQRSSSELSGGFSDGLSGSVSSEERTEHGAFLQLGSVQFQVTLFF